MSVRRKTFFEDFRASLSDARKFEPLSSSDGHAPLNCLLSKETQNVIQMRDYRNSQI